MLDDAHIVRTGDGSLVNEIIEEGFRALKEDEAAALAHQAIAMDGIAVIVNLENPTEDMTVEQIASIFLGDATKWNEMVK